MKKLSILLVCDYEIERQGIKLVINTQPGMEIGGEAHDGLTAIACAQSLLPDVALIDVAGASVLTKELRQVCPQSKVVVLAGRRNTADLQRLMRAGAYGYVLKQSPAAELFRAIRAVAGGNRYLDPAMSKQVVGRYMADVKCPSLISKREEQVLRLIAWGYSNKEIAANIGVSVKTVEAHRANAMRGLNLHNRIDIVRFAIKQGWLEEE